MTSTPTESDLIPPPLDDDEPHNADSESLATIVATSLETAILEAASPVKEADFVQSDFWFEDGNIILVASDGIGFRVHRSILAHHSNVFRDLFDIRQAICGDEPDACPCPIVPISVPADDLSKLMRALYGGRSWIKYDEPLLFSTAAPLLKLALKYGIEHLTSEILARMRTVFCHRYFTFMTSAEFTEMVDLGEKVVGLKSDALIVSSMADAIEAVNLIRFVGESTMLPMALYLCTSLPLTTLISGATLPNGQVVRLSKEDVFRCLEARTTLALKTYKLLERITSEIPSSECPTTQDCTAARQAIRLDIDEAKDAIGSCCQVHALYNWDKRIGRQPQPCNGCMKHLLKVHLSSVCNIWDSLPADFGLSVPQWRSGINRAA
ncbi:hypothetical protein C8Q73DRAFT_718381 [Cubamyces lactineus]|nr:hypothetical protein C8Q73DRAFT_718381 [Cubamyces lactineus]